MPAGGWAPKGAAAPPFTTARTVCRFGLNRRGVTLWAWLMFRPKAGPFPQISQRWAMMLSSSGARPG